jgi:hypothetical protein
MPQAERDRLLASKRSVQYEEDDLSWNEPGESKATKSILQRFGG